MKPRRPSAGFTLVEAVVAIVITGILAGIVAVFIASPVQGYVDSVRRAELTDAADVALRRMMRDIRLALPNSLRVTSAGGVDYI
ncbi:MAG: type II secretion system protein, partial [Candidatus Paceibacterota bacterium]